MKNQIKLTLACFSIGLALSLSLIGCGTIQSHTTPEGTPEYVYNPAVSNAVETARAGIRAFVPQPFAAGADGLLGAFSAVALAIAAWQTRKAKQHELEAKQQRSAADTLAGIVVQSGKSVAALQNASGTSGINKVAEHIDNNTTL